MQPSTAHVRHRPRLLNLGIVALLGTTLLIFAAMPAAASSHREAPGILSTPQVDGTDFYMFRSYEPGREGFVTFIANYNPLQDPYGGPNYFPLDPNAFYDINIDNDGDAIEDMTFRFKVTNSLAPAILPVGDAGATEDVAVPLVNIGSFGPGFGVGALTVTRSYTVRVTTDSGTEFLRNSANNIPRFGYPFDNIGTKSIPNYAAYADLFVTSADIPGCGTNGRVFVGQRKESFAVNLGDTFDLVNLNPLGPVDGESSDTDDKNITTIALEVPISCLTAGGNGEVIGAWTTAWLPTTRTFSDAPTFNETYEGSGGFSQVSRLGNPLVNEVAIGLPDKNLFNASHPQGDAALAAYVTHPTLPELLEILFGVTAPNAFPREDLVQIFLTGVPGLNDNGSVAEMMRLNTGVAATPRNQQNNLGVVGGDLAGYPNGRRPGDDVVDISLRAVMGVLLPPADAPDGQLPYTDGALQNAGQFDNAFPYLTTPIPGSAE